MPIVNLEHKKLYEHRAFGGGGVFTSILGDCRETNNISTAVAVEYPRRQQGHYLSVNIESHFEDNPNFGRNAQSILGPDRAIDKTSLKQSQEEFVEDDKGEDVKDEGEVGVTCPTRSHLNHLQKELADARAKKIAYMALIMALDNIKLGIPW